MCGIVAVLRRRVNRPQIEHHTVLDLLDEGLDSFKTSASNPTSEHGLSLRDGWHWDGLIAELAATAGRLNSADRLLRSVAGLRLMLDSPDTVDTIGVRVQEWLAVVDALESKLDTGLADSPPRLERLNRQLLDLRDSLWAIGHDRLGAAQSVTALLSGAFNGSRATGAVEAMFSVHQVLSSLDRLEVRGRDSAGVHLLIQNPRLDANTLAVLQKRGHDHNFASGSVRLVNEVLSIVYKTAVEIGDLGCNTEVLRTEITDDELLASVLASDAPVTQVLGHTRWASVGIISEPNAHPLNSDSLGMGITDRAAAYDVDGNVEDSSPHISSSNAGNHYRNHYQGDESIPDKPTAYVVTAVNGDIDNYVELLAEEDVTIPPAITTDSKTVPVLMSQRLQEGLSCFEAFRSSVAACEGSVAIASITDHAPDRLLLALRGSGQGLYVGLAEDAFVVASEPYGLVEETARYVRMDGEAVSNPDDPNSRNGQIIELDRSAAGSLAGVKCWSYNGDVLPLTADSVVTAEITTRDVDRGEYSHFFLKEIGEAPLSFRKTLRGRIVDSSAEGGLELQLGAEVITGKTRNELRSSQIKHLFVIGQGTAAVAGISLAEGLRSLLRDVGLPAALDVQAMAASELSAFHLRSQMSDTLVIAISQSGTTTDTNRTVDLVRSRGATVIAIVNRRNSDLTERADGVLYTSDGRDVEMSVASTKAFYSQVAAGWLLALTVADEVMAGVGLKPDSEDRGRLLRALVDMPEVLEAVLKSRGAVAEAARRFAPSRRHWAVVGSGVNRVAAQEIRIKLSELCYKSIPNDITEDKKHIDLSSEPLIVVCAAGLPDFVADDISKEVAIFQAHRGAPIVITDDAYHRSDIHYPGGGSHQQRVIRKSARFDAACAVLTVPEVDVRLACIPVTMAGHLFGYEAALAIDGGAQPLHQARCAVESALENADVTGEQVLQEVKGMLEQSALTFWNGLCNGEYDGHLETSTAVRISTVLRYALQRTSFDFYELEMGRTATPEIVIEDLLGALSAGIDELTRPVDAIRHQAKTVTVGISRSDDTFLQTQLVQAMLAAGTPRARVSYSSLRTLAYLDPAVAEVQGHTRYSIEGMTADPTTEQATVAVIDQGGISLTLQSRTKASPELTGTKHQVAIEREVLAERGRYDGRTLVFIPEVVAGTTVGITLLHVRFCERLPATVAREILQGYRKRYLILRDTVTETESVFDESLLSEIKTVDLLTAPVSDLADRWRIQQADSG
ncbi:MAG: SIS domain-containing protein [Acidimicrobiaceae bacterium]|nr:SIS domain-containing protein [Acidimicrobiaceae bacterium]